MRKPKYALHKKSGQARVIIHGKYVYLGKYNSADSLTSIRITHGDPCDLARSTKPPRIRSLGTSMFW